MQTNHWNNRLHQPQSLEMKHHLSILLLVASSVLPLAAETDAEKAMRVAEGIVAAEKQKSPEEIEAYIKSNQQMSISSARGDASSMQVQLDSSQRKIDIFGASVGEPAVVNGGNLDATAEQRKNTAAEAIKALRIVGVSPERGEFYIDAWIMHRGDNLTLMHSGQVFSFNIQNISAEAITFQEADTGSKIVARINIVPSDAPPEMVPISR